MAVSRGYDLMLEETEVIWVQDGFTGAWEPLDNFTREEMEALERE